MTDLVIKINQDALESRAKLVMDKVNLIKEKQAHLETVLASLEIDFQGQAAERILENMADMLIKTTIDTETVATILDLLQVYCKDMIQADNDLQRYLDGAVN